MNKDGNTLSSYRQYVEQNLPPSWRKVAEIHGVLEQLINAIAKYCYEHLLTGCELYYHLHENELICSAHFEREPQGVNWWMDLSSEASILESNGCIETFCDND